MKTIEKVHVKQVTTKNAAKTFLAGLNGFITQNPTHVLGYIILDKTLLSHGGPIETFSFYYNEMVSKIDLRKVSIAPEEMINKHPDWIIIVDERADSEPILFDIDLQSLWEKLGVKNPVKFYPN